MSDSHSDSQIVTADYAQYITEARRRLFSGEQIVLTFPNGWGVSLITGEGTYSDYGTFEAAVLAPSGEIEGHEVKGWLTPEEVRALFAEVMAR